MHDPALYILPVKIGDYIIRNATPSGGKAGKGCNVTSTIQVFTPDDRMKQFRYKMFVLGSKKNAITKAIDWVHNEIQLP